MKDNQHLISIVIPVYFEEEVIGEFYMRLKDVLDGLAPAYRHEMVFVNDGSTDRSLSILEELRGRDDCVKIIDFSRNFGHQVAISAGIDHATGDAVVIIDGDLQDPPEVIPQMLDKWREGYRVVYGVRSKRKGESAFKLLTAKAFYRVLGKLSDFDLPLDAGDFRLMDRLAIDALRAMPEESRYIRGMVSWIGFKQYGIAYERDARYAGETKYTFKKMIRFALDGIFSFSEKPLKLSSSFGMMITALSFTLGVGLVADKLVHPNSTSRGWTSMVIAILFMGGVQLISVGILGEYIARVFKESKRRPLYVVAKKFGFEQEDTFDDARVEE